ncbi:MAG: DUF47 family protein [Candidatus Omnitrophica bacterium]|nr:DUF47 family protein [Candidatus Omnitrophota bacterium]MDE2221818.1 DUF47 family protein [Candidatus Omnitrophota bacterium]
MILDFLFPKEFDFFTLFEEQVNYAVQAAGKFKEIASTPGLIEESSYQAIQHFEHKGDDATHAVIDQLNKSFITPFDREDIHALTKELDNITDVINTMVGRIKVYKIPGGDKHLMEFSRVIEESVLAVAKAVKGMRVRKNGTKAVLEHCVEINRLENVGDAMRDAVLFELFESKSAIEIIKWKEIYQDAETVLDICEDVANVVESILVKQA